MSEAEKSEIEQLRQVADRLVDTVNAEKPTKAQLAELREQLKEMPSVVGILGDMSRQLRRKIIETMALQPGLHIVVTAKAKQMAKDLGAEQATQIERLLIDQVIIAWLRWQTVEWTYQRGFAESITLTKALYFEKRLSAAHRRYLNAIESLARVKRLLKRAPVQINIAQQQIVSNG